MTGAEPVKTDFVAFTWNACGMEKCAEQDLVDMLDTEKVYWDAMLIQEGPISEKSGCKVVQGGHLFYVGPPGSNKRTACILLHRRWQQAKLSFHVVDERTVFLDLEAGALRLCLTSAHLPHGDALVEVYEAALEAVETVVARARKWRRIDVIGVDANAILGRQNETDDATIIGEHGVEQRNARGHIFAAWLHGQRLSAAATMRSKPWNETWTHELWNTKARRQIDYILLTKSGVTRWMTLGLLTASRENRTIEQRGPRIAWATRGTICRGHPRQWQGAAAVTSDDVHGY